MLDGIIACLLLLVGWSVGVGMAWPVRRAKLHVADEAHAALDGPLGVIVKNGRVRR